MGWSMQVCRYGCLGMLLVGGLAQANEVAQRYGCERPIRVALQENIITYHEGKGFEPDLVAELQKRSGCTFEALPMRRSATWEGLADGNLDMVANGAITLQRRHLAFFIPGLYYRNKLIVPVDLASRIAYFSDFQRLPEVKLGVVRGVWDGAYFDSTVRLLRTQGRVLEYANDAERFAALRSGVINGLISHDLNLRLMVPVEEQLRYRVLDLNPGPSLPVGLLLSRRNFTTAQAAEWLRLIEAMRLDGGMADLVRANIPEYLVEEFLRSGYHYDVSKRNSRP